MRVFLMVFMLFIPVVFLYGQYIAQLEFNDQPISDILMILAKTTGSSIILDDTVKGNATYHFSDTDLPAALHNFLSCYDLHLLKRDDVYHVSRILTSFNEKTGLLSLAAKEVSPELLCKRIAKEIGVTILFDPLPATPLTILATDLPVRKVLEIIMRRFPDYCIDADADYFYIRKMPPLEMQGSRNSITGIERSGELYSAKADSILFSELISQLFQQSGREYCLLKRGDSVLKNVRYGNKTFDALLRLLLDQCDGDFFIVEDVYYIFDRVRGGVEKKLGENEYMDLGNIPVESISSLLPPDLVEASNFRMDRENNGIILSGTAEELAPVRSFITGLKRRYGEKQRSRIDLSFLTCDELLKYLPEHVQKTQIVRTVNPMSLILDASTAQTDEFISYVRMIDTLDEDIAVPLRYIRADDLLQALPSSVKDGDIVKSGDPNMVYFRGSPEKFRRFLKDLKNIDKPMPQIRYELLVVQYQRSGNREFSFSMENCSTRDGDRTSVLGTLGSLLHLNIDIVSTFGYQFAIDLNNRLSRSRARILANTTLNGITGENISFQNTNTYRYRDLEIDPDTGEAEQTGVTREIISGLIIRMNGWISGDEMITMDVESTISKRGADVSASTGNPPPTSEKVVQTHVRTRSGMPVVIGGLFQHDHDEVEERTPFLSSLPFLGSLFTNRTVSSGNTELVIYIVPYLEYPGRGQISDEEVIDRYFEKFLRKESEWGGAK